MVTGICRYPRTAVVPHHPTNCLAWKVIRHTYFFDLENKLQEEACGKGGKITWSNNLFY